MPVNRCFLILILCCLYACQGAPDSPEEQVRQTLSAIESNIEARDLSATMAYVSDQYRDHQGQDKTAIKRLLQYYLLRNQSIHIFHTIHSLEVADNTASVELSAAMAANDVDLSQEQTRLNADLHRFSVVLQREDARTSVNTNWKVQSAAWQRGW